MDVLFLCKRILIDNNYIDGGILVTQEGTIRTILRTQSEVNSWMYSNEADEVRIYFYIILFLYRQKNSKRRKKCKSMQTCEL